MESLSLKAGASDGSTGRPGSSRKALHYVVTISAVLIVVSWMVIEVGLFVRETAHAMTALNIYTDALIQRDYESAYEVASPAFRAVTSYSALVADQVKLTERFGSLQCANQTYWDIDSINNAKAASIKVNLQFERGRVNFEFALRKEDGIWRVLSYKEPNGTEMGKN